MMLVSFLIIKYTSLNQYTSKDFLVSSRIQLRTLGELWYSPIIYVLAYSLGVIISFPGLILTLAGGIVFGTIKGTILNVLASNIGAGLSFFIGRYLGRDFAEKLIRGKLKSIDENLGENGLMAILRLRLIPLIPFNIFNYAAGFSKVSYKHYALGSFIGMLPATFIYTFLADSILIDTSKQKEAFIKLIIAVSLLILLSFVPNVIEKFRAKKNNNI